MNLSKDRPLLRSLRTFFSSVNYKQVAPLGLKKGKLMKPISKTAFYCCGVRMHDAESANPVCGDVHAKAFMNEEGLGIVDSFKDETGPNASNVARHRIIDDILRDEIAADPNLTVVIIGAGFDSRAFRLNGGRWIELDEPQVIEYKNERLPASGAANELHRVPIDFSAESLEEKLAPFKTDGRPIVVIEGVFMYLDEVAIKQLLHTLRVEFPHHRLVCDLMNRKFFQKYSKTLHEKLAGVGAAFKFTVDAPEQIFLANGYTCTAKISIVGGALRYGSLKIPKLLLKTLLRTLVKGYSIYVFDL